MRRPLVIAHRGASAELPENTLPAFVRAIELGADFVEFDVHPRRDGALVVSHDRPRGGERPPALAEVLELCRGPVAFPKIMLYQMKLTVTLVHNPL